MKQTFSDRLDRFMLNLKLRRLRKRCYNAIDKIRNGNDELTQINHEIQELTQ